MKRTYTQMVTTLQHYMKVEGFDPETDMDKCFSQGVSSAGTTWEDRLLIRAALIIDFEVIKGNAVHVYMPDKNFCEWIVDCVKELDSDNAKIVHETLGKDKVICLHFPTGQGLRSVAFCVEEYSRLMGEDGQIAPCSETYKNMNMSFSFVNGGIMSSRYILSCKNGESNSQTDDTQWYAKLILGLGMYLSCFPEQIIEGIPEDLKHPSYHTCNKQIKTVTICHKIMERNGPTPHYRTGHFRVLKSEFYKGKRNHVIFIHGTFVKGHAKTVLPIG